MTQPGRRGAGDSYGMLYDSGKIPPEGSERIGKRKKLAGYLKAANELRQSYQQSASERWEGRHADDYDDTEGIPGTFPDVSIVRHGHEELILFPSYCKRHHKRKGSVQSAQSTGSASGEGNDAEWWKQEWDRYEDDKAVVDVDVRGWVYSPHRGPMTRRNRFLVGLARQLSGVPAPKSEAPTSSEGSPPGSLLERHKAAEALRDQERIDREAEDILRKGEDEQEIASRGGYSEDPKHRSYGKGTQSPQRRSGANTPADHELLGSGHLNKRSSWNLPADMSPEELAKANTNLMARIMPFMTNPLVSTPITVFFYDDKRSQSKTVTTDESGHFNLRAALDFVPTHVRVLASENLSATEEVKITEPKGVSVISDVDDTIKHSSIGSGAREIFRNAFIRELGDLTIDGVKEWYHTMYDMGVGFHYVSNSPWQLFPVLVTFFQKAGLPPGSYHLKQYSGMLQGIFEPVAERKKGTLERILNDFPERKFVLIGDSGEADLEVYTDVVLANPGRILAIFIRDVTTPIEKGFFDTTGDVHHHEKVPSRGWSLESTTPKDSMDRDAPHNRPPLPIRIRTEVSTQTSNGPVMGKLIDFEDEPENRPIHEPHHRVLPRSNSDLAVSSSRRRESAPDVRPKIPPPRPSKPQSLRSATVSDSNKPKPDMSVPPLPTRPKPAGSQEPNNPIPPDRSLSSKPPPPNQSYISAARTKVTSAYNAIPPASSYIPGLHESPSPPDLPARRGKAARAAAYASDRLSWGKNDSSDSNSSPGDAGSGAGAVAGTGAAAVTAQAAAAPVNKKLELWKRRWVRAEYIMRREDVMLRRWRVGQDVMLDAARLVEKNLREMGVEGYGVGRSGEKGKTGQGGGEVKVKDLK